MNFETWQYGKSTGFVQAEYWRGVLIASSMIPPVEKLILAAAKEGVEVVLAYALKSYSQQLEIRRINVIDKSKVDDEEYLKTANPGLFKPETGLPGWSKHQQAKAVDFKVTGRPAVYAWLVRNAEKFSFFRTVPSERWHWEYWPDNTDKFFKVPKNHATWDGLV